MTQEALAAPTAANAAQESPTNPLKLSTQQGDFPQSPCWNDQGWVPGSRPGSPPVDGFMRRPEVCRLLQISGSTLWRWIREGKFVEPVKLSDRVTAWSRQQVHAWMRSKEAK